MSFFAAFGETLNSAIENVGNIVAPLDDSFEEDVSFDVNEEDAMLEAIRRPGQEQENGTGELALAADRMIDQQQEEIDYLRNKVQSLAIELANRTDRENILHIKITELTEKVVELEGKGLDSRLSLDKTLIELEETRRRQQVCEMAMVSAELKCHELEDKISLLETDSSKSTDSFSRLNTCSNQILWIVSALTEMSRLLSHLGTIEEKISTPAYSVESILALLDSSTVEDMLTAWGAPSCSGRRGGDELVCTAVKDVFFALGSALRQAHNNRNEWEAIITACENLSARVSDHGSSVPKLNPSSLFYETARVAVNNAIGVVTSELQNKQDALIRLAQEKVFWCDQRDIMIKNNSEKEQLLLAAKKIEQDLKDESKQLCDELISMKSQINELKSGGLGRHIAGNVDESLELEECRRDVKRLSHEVQQLQQVITQLRSAEKSKINPDENEHDQSTYILSLKAEIVSLQTLLVENNEKNGELEKHIALLTASCGDDAATIDRFEREICELRSTANEHANREQSLHASANELTLALMEKEDLLRTGQQALTAVEQRLAIEIQANAQNINELSALKLEVVKLNNEIAFENSNSSATVEANELKNALIQNQRLEHEQKQLHQVISQLRQARKTSREDSDGAAADRASLKQANELLCSENSTLKLSLSEKSLQLEQAFRKLQDISASFQSVSVEISRGEHENSILHKRLGDSEQNESDLSKRLFDAETQVETLQADLLLARQDLAFRDTELYNLRNAIEGLSRDADHRVEVMKKDGDRILNQELEKRDKECSVLKENYEQKISILLDNVKEAQQRETDESLLRRKSELEYVSERKRLQTAVEQAMLRLQNSNEDLVDRAVIANLIVTYFKRNRSKEILDLIARMLCFTNDQKVTVGLLVATRKINPVGYLSSFIGGIVGSGSAGSEEEIKLPEGDSLAEMWVNFLLEESDQKPQKVVSSRSSSFSDNDAKFDLVSRSSSFSTVSLATPSDSPIFSDGSLKSSNYVSTFELSPASPKVL